jgi:iron complex outermembrane receptor protein
LAVAGLAVMLTTRPAFAQPSQVSPGPDVDERALFLDVSRVVSASRYEQQTQDAPASITILTAEDIRRYGYQNLAEAVNGVRGFWINNDRNYSYIGIRGLAVPGDYNSRVLILVDGHRLNDNVYSSALVGTEEVIDIDLVERIEIVRGPGSSLYGSSAVFGVINIVTRQGRWTDGGTATLSFGSFRSSRAAVTYGTRTRGGLDVLVGGSAYRSDGANLSIPTLFASTAAGVSAIAADGPITGLDRDSYRRAFAKVSTRGVTFQGGFSSRQKWIPTGSYGTQPGATDTWTRDSRAFGLASLQHTFGDLSRFSGSVALDWSEYRGSYRYDTGLLTDTGIGAWWTAIAHYDRSLGSRHRLLAGVELRQHLQRDQRSTFEGEPTLNSRRGGRPWGLFVQDEIRLADDLHLHLGARLDHDACFRYGRTAAPRGSVLWTPGAWAVKLLYGTAFRAPNAYELYFHDDGLSTKPSERLDPERVGTIEAVLEREVRPGLRVSASWFRMDLSDLIRLDLDPVDSLLVFGNLARARSSGVEVETSMRHRTGFDATASYAFQVARDPEVGDRLVNAPAHVFQARASAPILRPRLRASLTTRHVSGQLLRDGSPSPPYTIADMRIIGSLPDDRVSIEIDVTNLFNHHYGAPGGEEQVMRLIPQDGRSLRVGARVGF